MRTNEKETHGWAEPSARPLDRSVVVEVAECMLDHGVACDILGCIPTDVECQACGDGFPGVTGNKDAVTTGGAAGRVIDDVVEVFLEDALNIERELAETGHVFWPSGGFAAGVILDGDGHVSCLMGTVVRHNSDPTFVIDLDGPFVNEVVCRSCQRSLADQVRIFSQVVRLFHESVGPIRDCEAFSGEFIRNFRLAVGALSQAVRAYRNSRSDDSAHQASNADPD